MADMISYGPRFDANPLLDDSPEVWDQLVQALSPPSMLVSIRCRMSQDLLVNDAESDFAGSRLAAYGRAGRDGTELPFELSGRHDFVVHR